MPRRTAPPLTDEQLAAAEETQEAKDRARREALEDEQEQSRLARAGDPDAIAALAAGASALLGRPVESELTDEERIAAEEQGRGGAMIAARLASARERRAIKSEKSQKRPKIDAAEPDKFAVDAYRLMDTAFRKWYKKAEKNPREAFRELARDLGGDTAIYLKSGVLRMSDMLDSLMKLTALGKPKEEEPEGGEDFDAELESLRGALRGGK